MPIPPISLRTMPSRPCPNAGGKFSLLALGGVPRLGGLLSGAPPGLVLAVPPDGLGEALGEVCVLSTGFEQKEHRFLSSLSMVLAHDF